MSYPPALIAFAPAGSATTVYIWRWAVVTAGVRPGPAPAGTLVAPINARVARTVNRATRRLTSGLPPSRSCARTEEHGLCTATYDGRMDRGNPAERPRSHLRTSAGLPGSLRLPRLGDEPELGDTGHARQGARRLLRPDEHARDVGEVQARGARAVPGLLDPQRGDLAVPLHGRGQDRRPRRGRELRGDPAGEHGRASQQLHHRGRRDRHRPVL